MTTQETTPPPPSVMWAQRSGIILVTINLEDCKKPEIKIEKESVFFRGVGGSDHKLHEVTIQLYKEIDPEKSKSFNRDRCIELILCKASTEGPYWPSLTSDKKKHHWLKCDFNKWQDEDESADEGMGGNDFEEMMRQMGGLGAGGGEKPSFDDLEAGSGDSDDEELPDLE